MLGYTDMLLLVLVVWSGAISPKVVWLVTYTNYPYLVSRVSGEENKHSTWNISWRKSLGSTLGSCFPDPPVNLLLKIFWKNPGGNFFLIDPEWIVSKWARCINYGYIKNTDFLGFLADLKSKLNIEQQILMKGVRNESFDKYFIVCNKL